MCMPIKLRIPLPKPLLPLLPIHQEDFGSEPEDRGAKNYYTLATNPMDVR